MSMQPPAVDIETLQGLEPVSSLSAERLAELARKTFVESMPAGVALFREGSNDRFMVYLLDGELELQSSFNPKAQYITAGMPESWHPIANRHPRQVTATAATPVEIIRIDIDEFDRMLAWDQMAAANAGGDGGYDSATAQAAGKMNQSQAFRSLPPANIEELFRRMETLPVRKGEAIIRQGEPGDYYYILDSGAARVTRRMAPAGPEVELAMLGEGSSFGEEALISDNPRNATIIMIEDGQVRRLAKRDFIELLQEPMLDWVDLDAAFEALGEDAQFLDVRVKSEFNEGHLPNAIDIPLFELRQRYPELDPATHYICYCSTGRRSSAGAFLLVQNGFRASVLKDGLAAVPASFIIR